MYYQSTLLFIDKNKAVSLVCFIALSGYRKISKNMLLLDWCYNEEPSTQTKHRCLSQTGQSTTTWWWTKMLLLWLNSKTLGEHFTIWLWWATVRSFTYTLSKPYSPSFVFCCVGGVALHKKWSFSLRISFVNVTKSTVSCGFGQIYWRNL